jgi:hypothetical protein
MAKDTTKKTESEELPTSEQLAQDLPAVTPRITHKHKQCETDTRIDIRGVGDPLAFCRYCGTWFPVADFE